MRELKFSQFYRFKVSLFIVAILKQSNEWSCIKYLVKTQISVYGNFVFERSNDSILPNKQPWKSK